MYNNITSALKVTVLAIVLSFGISYVYAWTAPTVAAPGGNSPAPINTSATAQTKTGDLTLGGLTLNGRTVIAGGSNSTYGAVTVQGSKNTWSGINFKDSAGSNAGTLMMSPSSSGFFNAADTKWRMYVTDASVSWGGNVYANDYYVGATGKWASQSGSPTTQIRTSTVSAWRWPGATASCLASEVVTGGGGNCTSPVGYMVIAGSYPSGNGWHVQCDTVANTTATVTTYAVCMQK